MVAPHPVYSPRGTPISVLNRCKALCSLGHTVDLVTYGVGETVPVEGLRYLRAPVPWVRSVGVGPSWRKIPLDAAVFAKAAWLLMTRKSSYDVLHTHEEAGVLALLPGRRRLRHVYDMGNEFSVVAGNYGFGDRHPLTRMAALAERAIVRHADAVIAHFPSIRESIRAWGDDVPVEVVPNVDLGAAPSGAEAIGFRRRWVAPGELLVLYAGTLEGYQGVDDLVDAMASLELEPYPLRLVVAGGTSPQVDAMRARAARLGLHNVVFTGTVPEGEVPAALAAADILVSPRAAGSNTPLKIFAYLRHGGPILATRIASHTQVLDEQCALLVEPGADGLALGLAKLAADPELRAALASAARKVGKRFTPEGYVASVASAYGKLAGAVRLARSGA